MNAVILPDPVYAEAMRAAAANGQSLEEFVAEAVRLHILRSIASTYGTENVVHGSP